MWGEIVGLVAREVNENGVPAITDKWPVKDIVYCSIIGGVMLMALLEWFLWVAAFLYCLVKVYQKAETTSIKVLAIIVMILFTALRCIFLPIMVVTLPLPSQVVQYFPVPMVEFLQWFAFWAFAGLLTVPWLFCVYQLVTHSIGRTKRIQHVLDEASAPKVVIIMPCYKEIPEVLMRTIDSLVDCEYPPSCLHIFLSFDGDQEDELYLNTIEKLGVPLTLDTYPKSIDVTYRSCRITVSRFKHGGKRHCQKKTFQLIDKIYSEYLKRNDNLFVLFIDSDCILDKVCIQNFMYEMELKPGSKQNMLAMTGVITSTTEKNSLITILQDMEYIHGQLFERSVESGCGAVTCLPGALTILRFSAFRRMAKYYFADKAEQCEDLFDYGKCHLGEDRWLTHLFMIGAKERYQIQMNTGAFCKTEAVQTYQSLLKQRRRWFLGFITNEVCMLTDIRLWRRYPILCIVRFMQNTIRTTALLFFIMVISIITTSQKISNLPVGFIAVSLGLNWVLMLYFGAKLGRYKIMLYPIMFVVNPFFNWCYMVYGIFTAGQRTWGGPRADAGTADNNTTPQAAIEAAEATGDDLNVVPETFKPAAEVQRKKSKKEGRAAQLPLMPSDHLEGRFAPAERLPGGWYQQGNDSGLTLPDMLPRDPNAPRLPLHPRESFDSFITQTSGGNNSIYMPRRVESVMDVEGVAQYHLAQAAQRPAGGAFYEQGPSNAQYGPVSQGKAGFHESVDSLDSSNYGYIERKDTRDMSPVRDQMDRQPHSRAVSENSVYSSRSKSPGPGSSPLAAELKEYGNNVDPNRGHPALAANQPNTSPYSNPNANSSASSLTVPVASHRPTSSVGSAGRQGRSPLARASFVRTGEDLDLAIEMQQQQGLMDPRDRSRSPATYGVPEVQVHQPSRPTDAEPSSSASQPQQGHERTDSRDSQGKRRKRLTKQPPSSRRQSQAD
ncbi:Fungal chitin synthase [Neofusicoccum parvum]|uniref:chitin synthase n=2 Tax=Neofusicoccum parvum TaxID=310453 RepID=R1EIV4_BOTPV|nr:putative chitin synthase d protein [Neofusicoccum parvum UCRNP2]GME23749.1 Fungal chitin synthase [Neofusicoccum parvum]GME41925.1 Fungal chitin synthase [Neofusicoccum parvum]